MTALGSLIFLLAVIKDKKHCYALLSRQVPVSYSSNVRWFIHLSENQIDHLISFRRHSRFSC